MPQTYLSLTCCDEMRRRKTNYEVRKRRSAGLKRGVAFMRQALWYEPETGSVGSMIVCKVKGVVQSDTPSNIRGIWVSFSSLFWVFSSAEHHCLVQSQWKHLKNDTVHSSKQQTVTVKYKLVNIVQLKKSLENNMSLIYYHNLYRLHRFKSAS